jgi:hypothetical protein
MVRGLDFFSKCAIAESGIGDEIEADVALEVLLAEGAEVGWEVVAERPLAPLIERAELRDFDEEANPPDVLEDRAGLPTDPDATDRCAPDIPLMEETESVLTEADALLAAVRPEVDAGFALLCCEEFCR